MIVADHDYWPETGLGTWPRPAALDVARRSFAGLDKRYMGGDDLFQLVDAGGRLARRSSRSNSHVRAVKRADFYHIGGELLRLLDDLLPTEAPTT